MDDMDLKDWIQVAQDTALEKALLNTSTNPWISQKAKNLSSW